jgi:twitching motility protein PilT
MTAATSTSTGTGSRIERFLSRMKELDGSDLHLSVGRMPMMRVDGRMEPLRYRVLSNGDFRVLVEPVVPPHIWSQYEATGDADFALDLPGVSRFRVNLFRHERGMGGVFRNLSGKLVSLTKLGLPEAVGSIVDLQSGLVLVTGPTGSGKSTTLAAILGEINAKHAKHIVTIEDPIEFVHDSKAALVSQREVGTHADSFSSALLAATRENPDVILVGEMRDTETIAMALSAAETGVLVFGTLHTNSAAKTVDRLIGAFPTEDQPGVRGTLASTLRFVLAQQLLPKKEGGGRVAAVEVLVANHAFGAMVREGKTHQIPSVIAQGKKEGMVGMDDTLLRFMTQGLVTPEDAYEKSIDKDAFRAAIEAKGTKLSAEE